MSRVPPEIEDAERAAEEALRAAEAAKQAAAEKKNSKKPRKDRGTRRVNLPVAIVEDLDRRFPGAVTTPEAVSRIIKERDKAVALAEGAIVLPPAVLAHLAPAAAGSGRSISGLLGDIEGDLVALLDGKLRQDGGQLGSIPVPALEDRLVEAFRARLRPQEPTS